MKIVRILHVVSTMDRAGQETLIMNLYRNINRDKIQFDFLCTNNKKGDYDSEIASLGGNIYYLNYNKLKNPILKHLNWIINYKKFFMTHPTYQIVHFHNYHAFDVLLQVLGAKLGKVKSVIVHSHNTNARHPILHKISRRILKIFNIKRLACSTDAGRWMYGRTKFQVIKNGIQVKDFIFNTVDREKIRESLNIKKDEILIIHIGRFNYQKNHIFILKIFNELIKKNSKFKLLLVGKGELEPDIRNLVNIYNINENVLFIGTRNDIPQLLSASDCFFFPSLFEGLGVVAIEAQTNGIPVVFSDSIPKEAIICENIRRLSLNAPIEDWINALKDQSTKGHLENNYLKINQNGYNIKESASQLSNLYLSC